MFHVYPASITVRMGFVYQVHDGRFVMGDMLPFHLSLVYRRAHTHITPLQAATGSTTRTAHARAHT